VRLLAGSLKIHNELEARIAEFKQTDGAITMSSGYVTNLATISSLLRAGVTPSFAIS
jgi:glycine C-acetyltransferase